MDSKGKQKHQISGHVPDFGAIFMSDSSTKEECLERKLFGLPYPFVDFVMEVKAGMILFLFEFTKRELYGVFQATSNGKMNIVPHAYKSSGKQFPAQVRFSTIWECHPPLSEPQFKNAIRENYFSTSRFNFGLSRNQVCRLLWLFDSRRVRVPKQGHLSLGDENMTPKQPQFIPSNLINDTDVLGIGCSSNFATSNNSTSVTGFSPHLSASESRIASSQKEPENLETDLGDFIPLSSSSESDSDSSPVRDPFSGIVESSSASSRSKAGDCHQHCASDYNLCVKGLYSDTPTKSSSVFSRLNMPLKDRPQVQENIIKVDRSVFEIMEELQQKHEKWRVGKQPKPLKKKNEDLSVRKESVFSRLSIASKHDSKVIRSFHRFSEELNQHSFNIDRSSRGVREELQQYGSRADRPCAGFRGEFQQYGSKVDRPSYGFKKEFSPYGYRVDRYIPEFWPELQQRFGKREANSYKQENEVRVTGKRATVFSRLNWASQMPQPTIDFQEVKLSENEILARKENFDNSTWMDICKFSRRPNEQNSEDISRTRGMAGEISGLSSKRKSELQKAQSEIERSGCMIGTDHLNVNEHKRMKVKPYGNRSYAETNVSDSRTNVKVPSTESSVNKENSGDVSQKDEVSPAICPMDCNSINEELSKSTTDWVSKLGELVAKICNDAVTSTKPLKTYKRRRTVSPTVQDCKQKTNAENPSLTCDNVICNEKISVEAANAVCSKPSIETEGGAECGELLSPKVGVQNKNPPISCEDETCDQKICVKNGNAESSEPSTETNEGVESGELLTPKVDAQPENPSITGEDDNCSHMVGVKEENAECEEVLSQKVDVQAPYENEKLQQG